MVAMVVLNRRSVMGSPSSQGRKRSMQRAHLRQGELHVGGQNSTEQLFISLVCERGLCFCTSYNASPFASVYNNVFHDVQLKYHTVVAPSQTFSFGLFPPHLLRQIHLANNTPLNVFFIHIKHMLTFCKSKKAAQQPSKTKKQLTNVVIGSQIGSAVI